MRIVAYLDELDLPVGGVLVDGRVFTLAALAERAGLKGLEGLAPPEEQPEPDDNHRQHDGERQYQLDELPVAGEQGGRDGTEREADRAGHRAVTVTRPASLAKVEAPTSFRD